MSAAPEEEEFAPPPQSGQSEEELALARNLARMLVWICPGVGFAGFGLPVLAWASYFIWFLITALFAWLIYTLDPVAQWAFWVTFAVGLFLWLVEVCLIWFPTSRTPAPRFLSRMPVVAIIAIWSVSFAWGGLMLLKLGSVVMAGKAMLPTVREGEQFVYWKQVEEAELKRGSVIIFRTPPDSGWQPNVLVIARIAAVSGDRIGMRDGRLHVNGEPGPVLGHRFGRQVNVIGVPEQAAWLIFPVPKDCYFVCSDDPSGGLDSRMLGWAERDKIVSTRVWYLRRNQFFERVE